MRITINCRHHVFITLCIYKIQNIILDTTIYWTFHRSEHQGMAKQHLNYYVPNQNKVFLFLFLFNQLSEYDLDCRSSRSYFNSEKCNFPDGIRSRDISVASQTNALPTELMEISTDAKWNIHIENIL